MRLYEKLKSLTENEIVLDLVNKIEYKITNSLIYKIIALVVTGSVLSTISYAFGYIFLYGYYFSGKISFLPSALQTLILPVPFNFYSVMISSIFIVISTIVLVVLVRYSIIIGSKNTKLKERVLIGFSGIIFFFVFHIIFSIFFINIYNNKLYSIFTFLLIWVVPLVIVVSGIWLIQSIKAPITALSGFIYSILVTGFLNDPLSKYFILENDIQLTKDVYFTIGVYLSFVISALYSRLNNLHYKEDIKATFVRFFTYIPWLLLLLIIIDRLDIYNIKYEFKISVLVPLFILLSILLIVARYPWFKKQDNVENRNDAQKKSAKKTRPTHIKLILMGYYSVVIIGFFVSVYIGTLLAGKYLREFSPRPEFSNIQIVPYSNSTDLPIVGTIVAIKDSTYYISDKHWRLIIIRSDFIRSEPIIDERN